MRPKLNLPPVEKIREHEYHKSQHEPQAIEAKFTEVVEPEPVLPPEPEQAMIVLDVDDEEFSLPVDSSEHPATVGESGGEPGLG